MPDFDYDLLVIGSGPGGHRAALQAAKMNKKVAVVERKTVVGGVSVNLGTIPSKTLREAVIELSGYHEKSFYGQSFTVKQNITINDLFDRTDQVIKHEIDVLRDQMSRNGVELIAATASFCDQNTLNLEAVDGRGMRLVRARNIVIGVGTHATRGDKIPFDGKDVFTSDDILSLDRLPRTLIVVGGGVIGMEYTSMFAALGVRVTLVEKGPRILPFVDEEIVDGFFRVVFGAEFRVSGAVDRIRAAARLHTTDDLTPFDPGVPFRDTAVERRLEGGKARTQPFLP